MKILFVADEPSKALWDFYEEKKLSEIDLIISCGDLPHEYLSFLVTMSKCPLFYVRGNHDKGYERHPPEGCDCIEDQLVVYQGLRIVGLGGSYQYAGGPPYQYTEKEMRRRYHRLRPKIAMKKGFDLLVTHAPVYGLNDQPDLPHRGFDVFMEMLDRYEPAYMAHGHVHLNYGLNIPRVTRYRKTTIINGYERYVLNIPGTSIHQ